MKQLILTLPILLFLTGCSSTVTDEDKQAVQTSELKGEWTKVDESTTGVFEGQMLYIDFGRIRKDDDGDVYYWELRDFTKPHLNKYKRPEDMSYERYYQGDCDQFRVKRLSRSSYSQPMGKGTPNNTDNKPAQNWTDYSFARSPLRLVCDYVKLSEEDRQRFVMSAKLPIITKLPYSTATQAEEKKQGEAVLDALIQKYGWDPKDFDRPSNATQ